MQTGLTSRRLNVERDFLVGDDFFEIDESHVRIRQIHVLSGGIATLDHGSTDSLRLPNGAQAFLRWRRGMKNTGTTIRASLWFRQLLSAHFGTFFWPTRNER
jgi:hypothetical protein